MIDFHSHIIPGVDDGCRDLKESQECLKHLSSMGFTEIVPTSHKGHLMFNPDIEHVKELFNTLKSPLLKRFSFEYMFSEGIFSEENVIPLYVSDEGWKVILVEFIPFMNRSDHIEKAVFFLNTHGITPLLAHIERYMVSDSFWTGLKEKYSVFYQGGLQSLGSSFFSSQRKQLIRLLEMDVIDNIATDIHRFNEIPFIEKSLDFFIKKFPSNLVKKCFDPFYL